MTKDSLFPAEIFLPDTLVYSLELDFAYHLAVGSACLLQVDFGHLSGVGFACLRQVDFAFRRAVDFADLPGVGCGFLLGADSAVGFVSPVGPEGAILFQTGRDLSFPP